MMLMVQPAFIHERVIRLQGKILQGCADTIGRLLFTRARVVCSTATERKLGENSEAEPKAVLCDLFHSRRTRRGCRPRGERIRGKLRCALRNRRHGAAPRGETPERADPDPGAD